MAGREEGTPKGRGALWRGQAPPSGQLPAGRRGAYGAPESAWRKEGEESKGCRPGPIAAQRSPLKRTQQTQLLVLRARAFRARNRHRLVTVGGGGPRAAQVLAAGTPRNFFSSMPPNSLVFSALDGNHRRSPSAGAAAADVGRGGPAAVGNGALRAARIAYREHAALSSHPTPPTPHYPSSRSAACCRPSSRRRVRLHLLCAAAASGRRAAWRAPRRGGRRAAVHRAGAWRRGAGCAQLAWGRGGWCVYGAARASAPRARRGSAPRPPLI